MSKILITDPKFKQKSKFRVWFKRIIIILFFVLLIGIIYLLLLSPIFSIKKIILIEDNKETIYPELSAKLDEILKNQKLFILSGSNLFIFNSDEARQILLQNFSQLETLGIKKELPNKLIINFSKRKPAVLFCNAVSPMTDVQNNIIDNSQLVCFAVDKNGFVFNPAVKTEGFLFLTVKTDLDIKVGEKVIEPQILDFLIKIKENIGQKILNLTIKEFELTKENLKLQDVTAKTNEGWNIYFDLSLDPIEKLENLKKVLELDIKDRRKNLEYIDLRFGNKIFYKYK